MIPADSRARRLALLLCLLVAAAGAVWLTTPPAPLGVDAAATRFSADRAMRDIAMIGRAPHPTGSAAAARVDAYLAARLRGLGLEVREVRLPLAAKPTAKLARWCRCDVRGVALVDLVATWPGVDRAAPAVLLIAHHDTVWGSPGAADDSAGVATLLEEVRALRAAGVRPARDVVLLLSDGEELGLAGARGFLDLPGVARRIGMVVNHETRGGGGRTMMFETGRDNGPAMALFARAVPHPLTNSMAVQVYRLMPNSTDLTAALAHGLPAFNFAFLGRPALYHSPLATPAALDRGALQDMGDQSLALVRALATAPALPPRGPDAAFGDLLGRTTLAYRAAWGWLPLALAAGLLALRWPRGARAGPALAAATYPIALAGLLLAAGNALSAGWAHPDYYVRLAATPRLEAQAALLCLAAAIASWRATPSLPRARLPLLLLGGGLAGALVGGTVLPVAMGLVAAALAWVLPETTAPPRGAAAGATLLLLLLAASLQLALPLAAPVLAWPALLGGGGLALLGRWPRLRPAVAASLGLALAQLLALAHVTFEAVGAPLPLAMLPFLLAALALVRVALA